MKRPDSLGILTGLVLVLGLVVSTACSGSEERAAPQAAGDEVSTDTVAEESPPAESPVVEEAAAPSVRETDIAIRSLMQPWTGDLDAMVERGVVRMLVTFSKTNYFLDLNEHRGIT